MPKDASLNGDATSGQDHEGPFRRVSGIQAKLHRWAAAEPGRRFDDLFNLVHDPATLKVAFERVASNLGARTAGSDGQTVARIESEIGVAQFLEDLRCQIKSGQYRPQPVRERKIPKPGGSGKVRRLGIPTGTANCAVALVSWSFGIVRHGHAPVPPAGGAAVAGAVRAAAGRWAGV